MTSLSESPPQRLSTKEVAITYRYLKGVSEKTPLVFVHGWAGSTGDWQTVCERYTSHGESIFLYDAAGFGQSRFNSEKAAQEADYSLDRYVEDLKVLLDAESVGRIRLVGHSWGGVVAMCFAARYPERVESLVAIGSAYFDPQKLLHQLLKWASYLIALILVWSKPLLRCSSRLRQMGVRRYFHRKPTPVVAEQIMNEVLQSDNRAIVQTLLTGYEVRFKKICPAIKCPTLYVGSDKDVVAPLPYVTAFVPLTPQAKATILTDCGHFPMFEQPDELISRLDQFFKETDFNDH
jgi:pimeloyl-ACP methyl ester carboxylesterase